MDKLSLVTLLFFLYVCQTNVNSSANDSKNSAPKVDTSLKLIQIASGQISLYEETIIEGSEFQVVVRDNDTLFLSTRDSIFRTPENYHIGTLYGDLPQKLKDSVKEEPGFSYWVDAPSGWRLGFCIGKTCTDYKPLESSTVDYIFERH
jgi:hypothetical protein